MLSTGGRRSLDRGLVVGATLLCTLIALFIAAPSTWGSGVVDHGGRVVEHTTESIAGPRTLQPAQDQTLQTAAHTLVMAVMVVVLGAATICCPRRLENVAPAFVSSPALVWVNRRGPPLIV
jgi:hypothetical protein